MYVCVSQFIRIYEDKIHPNPLPPGVKIMSIPFLQESFASEFLKEMFLWYIVVMHPIYGLNPLETGSIPIQLCVYNSLQ